MVQGPFHIQQAIWRSSVRNLCKNCSMSNRFPRPLQPGDHVRVIAPSVSLSVVETGETGEYVARLATQRLQELGLTVSFGEHAAKPMNFARRQSNRAWLICMLHLPIRKSTAS